jgi:hypothetical protein
MFYHHKIFREPHPKRKRNGKNMRRTWQDRTPSLFCPSWDRVLRGYKIEMRHSNAHLSIYGMRDAPTFMMGDGMEDTPAFMIGDGMEDVPAFVIKGDTPLAMRISFTCIIRDVQ